MTEKTPTTVIVVDDDALVRSGLKLVLEGEPEIEIVGEAADGREALALIAKVRPDIALMDIRMPRMDGIEALRELAPRETHTRVIMLTTFDSDESVFTSLQEGAAGFLVKDTPPADIVSAVRRCARGEPTLSPSVTTRVIEVATSAQGSAAEAQSMALSLTAREREVAIAVARGRSNAEIASELHISVATVKSHVGSLFIKLDASNRVQLARLVHEARIHTR
ncbi:response regulator [Microbacterium amylolyticum]|uniref:DNA-binding NarL/FixJ family response regulator n=1 Tax=Microbacterium amylolyticum TaxID=936337 RepID=A0ABS4ZHS6_9MICO|nr:response regulator transcription factor [Microbacterium amylolyticum]MBP2436608.1 DNA-binding NarL/FixJ family response regulator [Microbacterium amylolyticum]